MKYLIIILFIGCTKQMPIEKEMIVYNIGKCDRFAIDINSESGGILLLAGPGGSFVINYLDTGQLKVSQTHITTTGISLNRINSSTSFGPTDIPIDTAYKPLFRFISIPNPNDSTTSNKYIPWGWFK